MSFKVAAKKNKKLEIYAKRVLNDKSNIFSRLC